MFIQSVKAYQIYDSRGLPTIACAITINDHTAISMIPSGASTGEKEAIELRDNVKHDWHGKGVLKAIANINDIIAKKIINFPAFKQQELDKFLIDLDGSQNKSNLGANAILAVSLAYCKACAKILNLELFQYIREYIICNKDKNYYFPVPLVNVINGGCHANNNLDFQELMLVPSVQNTIEKTLKVANECFVSLQNIISCKNLSIAKGDEGGFSLNFDSIEDALDMLLDAIKQAGYVPGIDVFIAIDVAASEFFENGYYHIHNGKKLIPYSSDQMIDMYKKLISKYPIISIEDPLDENDWQSFSKLTHEIGASCQIVGDDLYCTNVTYLIEGIQTLATNSILIKLNQIGTLTECLNTIQIAQKNNQQCIISHRSGETEDTFIIDLLLATNSLQLKTGSFSRSERLSKYNRLLEIDNLHVTLLEPKEIKLWK